MSGSCHARTVYIPTQETLYLSAIVEILIEQLVLTGSDGNHVVLQVLLSVRPYKEDFTFISPVSEKIFINLSQHMCFSTIIITFYTAMLDYIVGELRKRKLTTSKTMDMSITGNHIL